MDTLQVECIVGRYCTLERWVVSNRDVRSSRRRDGLAREYLVGCDLFKWRSDSVREPLNVTKHDCPIAIAEF